MSAAALSKQTTASQAAWAGIADRFAAAWGARVATEDTVAGASKQLQAVFGRELLLAQQHGVEAARRMFAAATGGDPGPSVQPEPSVISPADLNHALARGWAQARKHHNPALAHRVRRATAGRIVDANLMDAWRQGIVAAMIANPQVVGWRRLDHAGACGACFALADGEVHSTSDAFPAHPRCRCIQQPVVLGVNDHANGPTPTQRWARMTVAEQDAMFAHRGGAAKADLIRSGQVTFDQLIQVEPRRAGQTPVVAETPLKTLSPPAAPATAPTNPLMGGQ